MIEVGLGLMLLVGVAVLCVGRRRKRRRPAVDYVLTYDLECELDVAVEERMIELRGRTADE